MTSLRLLSMIAGLAYIVYWPFMYGLSAFIPMRVFGQIKLDVAHDDLSAIFLSDGASFVYSRLGTESGTFSVSA